MRFRIILAVLAVGVLFHVSAYAAAPGMKDGLWEISTTVDMPGMPFKPPPTVMTHCYTKEDVKEQKNVVPKQEGDCKMTDLKQSKNKVSWKMVCTGQNKGKGEGEMIFKGDSAYEGRMKFETKEVSMTSKYKAKRLGECKK